MDAHRTAHDGVQLRCQHGLHEVHSVRDDEPVAHASALVVRKLLEVDDLDRVWFLTAPRLFVIEHATDRPGAEVGRHVDMPRFAIVTLIIVPFFLRRETSQDKHELEDSPQRLYPHLGVSLTICTNIWICA